jgi:hypothetical protein
MACRQAGARAMKAHPGFQRVANQMREMFGGRPFDGDLPPDDYWVTVRGSNAHAGVQMAFTVASDGAERLFIRTQGYSPPKKRTIRRWCAGFWGDDREAEWEIDDTTMRCWPKAGSLVSVSDC